MLEKPEIVYQEAVLAPDARSSAMRLVDQTNVGLFHVVMHGPQPRGLNPDDLDHFYDAWNAVLDRLRTGDDSPLRDTTLFAHPAGLPAEVEAPSGWSWPWAAVLEIAAGPGLTAAHIAPIV